MLKTKYFLLSLLSILSITCMTLQESLYKEYLDYEEKQIAESAHARNNLVNEYIKAYQTALRLTESIQFDTRLHDMTDHSMSYDYDYMPQIQRYLAAAEARTSFKKDSEYYISATILARLNHHLRILLTLSTMDITAIKQHAQPLIDLLSDLSIIITIPEITTIDDGYALINIIHEKLNEFAQLLAKKIHTLENIKKFRTIKFAFPPVTIDPVRFTSIRAELEYVIKNAQTFSPLEKNAWTITLQKFEDELVWYTDKGNLGYLLNKAWSKLREKV